MVDIKPVLAVVSIEKGKKWKNEHLPKCCMEGNRWRKHFVSTYIWFVSFQRDPWNIPDTTACKAMQMIWDAIYDEPYTIQINGPVFGVVSESYCYL